MGRSAAGGVGGGGNVSSGQKQLTLMTTFNRPLAAVDAACLDALVSDGVLEGRQLDYKQALPADAAKRDILTDVAAFANTLGGDIVYGIRERRDVDNQPTGEPDSIVGLPGLNYDATRRQLEAMLRDGVAPRIIGIQIVSIPRGNEAPCLVRVPRSGAAPHMVMVGAGHGRFYGRSPGGNYLLSVEELRMAFLSGATAVERLRQFRTERINTVFNGRGPVELRNGAIVMFHALPLNPPESAWASFRPIESEAPLRWLAPMDGEPATFRHNLDGFVVHTLATHPNPNSYVQLFRDGGIEAGSGRLIFASDRRGARQDYYPINIERAVIRAFSRFVELWRLVGVDAPVMCALTLTGLQGCRFVTTGSFGFTDATVDRDPLLIPETIVQTLDPADVVLRPLLDVVWNSGGWPGSPNYDAAGHWHDPARAG